MVSLLADKALATDFSISTIDGEAWKVREAGITEGKANQRPRHEVHGFRGVTFLTLKLKDIQSIAFEGEIVFHKDSRYKNQRLRKAKVVTDTGEVHMKIRVGMIDGNTLYITGIDNLSGAQILIELKNVLVIKRETESG
jgi:hypothetical protein